MGAAVVPPEILEKRKKREEELGSLTTTLDFPGKANIFIMEAKNNFVNSSYLSCIFASAASIEQVFKSEYVRNATNKRTAERELIKGKEKINNRGRPYKMKLDFFNLINECQNLKFKRLKGCFRIAHSLRKLRNKIGVHPLHIETFETEDSPIEMRRKNRTMVRDIRALEKFLNKDYVKEFEDIRINYKNKKGKIKSITFKDILKDNTNLDKPLVWNIAVDLLSYKLALKAHNDATKIIKRLYDPDNMKK